MSTPRAAALLLGSALLFANARASAGQFDDPLGTQPHDLDMADPPEDVENKCAACHTGGTDDNGALYRPWDSWSGTMMANAARDPLFLAALTVAEQDAPGAGTYCLRCHSPQAFVRGDATPGFGTALTDDDKEGVSCEGCHRSTDPSQPLGGKPPVDPKGPYAGNARLFWDPGPEKHGPYSDADSPAHTTVLDPFTSSSKLCGQCHELDNPAVNQVDSMGMDLGRPFPLDTTFTEWQASSYSTGPTAKGCIDCHMLPASGDLTLSTFPTAMMRHDPRMHVFVGGNVWGIDAVQAANPMLASLRKLQFNEAHDAAVAMLASAVKVAISGLPASIDPGAPFSVDVRVTNLSGHRFPTGYADGRRAFLRIELIDSTKTVLDAIGKYDDATHTLTADPELHVYEAVHSAIQGNGPAVAWHIAKSNTIVKDTRIPPAGFVPGPTTPILGTSYDDGKGGVRDYDEGTFHLAAPSGTPPQKLTVRATVLYQSTAAEFIDELVKSDTTDGRATALQTAWAATGNAAPIAIATAETTASILGSDADAGMDNDAGDAAASTGGAVDDTGAPGGCGCSVAGDAGESGAAWLMVVALLARRRRVAKAQRL